MLSITRSTEQNQFDYRFDADAHNELRNQRIKRGESLSPNSFLSQLDVRFDADTFARSKGFENAAHLNGTADLIAASYQLLILSKEIEARKARIAVLEAALEVRHA